MSEVKENLVVDDSKEWKLESGEWTLIFLFLMFGFGGWGNFENAKIKELEKKVARLEGQMSMIGGRFHE